MASGDISVGSLEHTPTWVVATVCFFFIFVSIVMEYFIHLLCNWLKRHKKTALHDAVDKLKSALMLLGFISLFLAVTQDCIAKICIPANLADNMLPCRKKVNEDEEAADVESCCADGKVSLITQEGVHQLHIFIFVLAVMQIVYAILTFGLGMAKMKRWKAWEKETQTIEYQVANDPNRFRLTRQTTFGRRHMTSCTTTSTQLWIKSFFRQFFHSVAKVDYFTLRHGFISAHFSTSQNTFNFQKHIERSLEEDFKDVVGISPLMWFVAGILLLLDVDGWYLYTWISYIPVLIVLVVGTKLEVVVARMALQVKEQNNVIVGTPLVKPDNKLFWFGKPRFILTLLHYTLFMNAFELAFYVWVSVLFGVSSCYHINTAAVVTRVVSAVSVQILCSYITLPLYALVTQMGSEFKSKVLEEQMGKIMTNWLAEVRERRKRQEQSIQSPRISLTEEWRATQITNTFTRVPSFATRMPVPSESIHKSNKGEIMEEESKTHGTCRIP